MLFVHVFDHTTHTYTYIHMYTEHRDMCDSPHIYSRPDLSTHVAHRADAVCVFIYKYVLKIAINGGCTHALDCNQM